jgi:hypothetical protein
MRISPERLQTLKALLKEQCGLEYTDEQAQEAGMAILRFVAAKRQRSDAQAKDLYRNGEKNGRTQRSPNTDR